MAQPCTAGSVSRIGVPEQTAVAAFDVFGRAGEDLPDLSALLGVEADVSHRRNQPNGSAGAKWSTDYWSIREEAGVTVEDDFAAAAERCLRRLLDRLKPLDVAVKLRRAGLLGSAQVAVFGFCAEGRAANLGYTAEVLRDLADLSVPLDEDFYIRSASGIESGAGPARDSGAGPTGAPCQIG